MKKYLGVLLLTVTLMAGELHWKHDIKSALEEAKKSGKPVLMMYAASWCSECQYMKNIVFNNKSLAHYMNQHFVLLAYDIDHQSILPSGYAYRGVPTFFFFDGDQTALGKIEGSASATAFLHKLEHINQ